LAEPVDLHAKLQAIDAPWSPRIVARYNENKVFLAKAKGEFVWHSHPETDDLFLVLEGELTIDLRAARSCSGRASCSSCRRASSTGRARSTGRRSS
jgi:mannose-6-phosphate isomerase-like protein (cupin superfamily)